MELFVNVTPGNAHLFAMEEGVLEAESILLKWGRSLAKARRIYHQMINEGCATQDEIVAAAESIRATEERLEVMSGHVAARREKLDRITAPSQDRRIAA